MPSSDARPVGGAHAVLSTASSVLAEMERRWLTPQDVVSLASRIAATRTLPRSAPEPVIRPMPGSVSAQRATPRTALLQTPVADRLPPPQAPIEITRREPAIITEARARVPIPDRKASKPQRGGITTGKNLEDEAPSPPATMPSAVPEVPVPAVDPFDSIGWAFVTCLEDGKKVRDLARHLRDKFAMKPEEYRAKWNLPKAYPMRAPQEILSKAFVAEYDPIRRTFVATRTTS